MELERKNVRFKSVPSTADNCICNACHGTGQVMKLSLPETRYFDGKHLTTKYNPYWVCRSCRDKLVKALEWRIDDGKAD